MIKHKVNLLIVYQRLKRCHNRCMDKNAIRLKNARNLAEKAGGAARFAELLGMSDSQVNQIIGKNPLRGIGNKIAARIENAFGKPPGWIDSINLAEDNRGAPSNASEEKGNSPKSVNLHEFELAPQLRTMGQVPVVGTIQAGELGHYSELEYPVGFGDGTVDHPKKDKNSYALRVKGDSMRPRIKPGEYIVVEPNTEPQNGDDVAVTTKDGQRMVKELLYIRDGEVCLGSINQDHPSITLDLNDIEKMHYVAAILPRGAFNKNSE